ncbi:MAG TPA: hypothetical protein DDW52_10655 [Planctomycetaceae bacterium]|nr:hypothetical protein [Planctomycetaceae bacterium]
MWPGARRRANLEQHTEFFVAKAIGIESQSVSPHSLPYGWLTTGSIPSMRCPGHLVRTQYSFQIQRGFEKENMARLSAIEFASVLQSDERLQSRGRYLTARWLIDFVFLS